MLQDLHAQRISEAVKESVVLEPRAKLLAEFNNNRFARPVVRLNGDVFDCGNQSARV
jgi:hypothetical protein